MTRHAEIEIWDSVANRRGLNADDTPGLVLALATMLDDRLWDLRDAIVNLTDTLNERLSSHD